MDVLTAALALLIALACIALVMTGVHVAARRERYTRYWAASAILIVAGVLVLIVAGPRQWLLQLVGNACLVFGAIAQFWGLQLFYRRAPGKVGWVVGAGYCLLFGLMLIEDAPPYQRIVLLSATMLVVVGLGGHALLAGIRSRVTFGGGLTLGGMVLLMLNNIARIVAMLRQAPHDLLMPESNVDIAVLFLVPLGGIFLYSTGLLLLYFERLVEEKHQLATHDELTGLLNRRALVAAGEREVGLAIRNRQPLSVAYVDIDFFKQINDEFGHEAGDQVLVELGGLLRRTCRSVDLVGRLGGEEFCLLLPGVGPDGAACVGERLLAAVREYRFRGRQSVTMSIGFASISDAGDERSWASLVQRADVALYRAKQAGRDRFCVAECGSEGQEPHRAS